MISPRENIDLTDSDTMSSFFYWICCVTFFNLKNIVQIPKNDKNFIFYDIKTVISRPNLD